MRGLLATTLFLAIASAACFAVGQEKVSVDPALNVDPIVSQVLRVRNNTYQVAGFKDFAFGMTRKEVETKAGALTTMPKAGLENWLLDKHDQLFLFENDALRGIGKRYLGNSDEYVDKIVGLLGSAEKENIACAASSNGAFVQSYLKAYWSFPKSLAWMKVSLNTDARTRERLIEEVILSVLDRRWTENELTLHAARQRKLLKWVVERLKKRLDDGSLQLSSLPVFDVSENAVLSPRTAESPTYSPTGKTAAFKWFGDYPLSERTEATAYGRKDKWFLVVEKVVQGLSTREPESGTLKIWLDFSKCPLTSNCPLYGSSIDTQITEITSNLAQEVFEPNGTTITVTKKNDSLAKSYRWKTLDGWEVVVFGGTIHLIKKPKAAEREL